MRCSRRQIFGVKAIGRPFQKGLDIRIPYKSMYPALHRNSSWRQLSFMQDSLCPHRPPRYSVSFPSSTIFRISRLQQSFKSLIRQQTHSMTRMPPEDPLPKESKGCSGGCCRPAAAPAQEQPVCIKSEKSVEEQCSSSFYGAAREEITEIKNVAAKDKAKSCTSACCGISITGPAAGAGGVGTAKSGLGKSDNDKQCGSGCCDGSSSEKQVAEHIPVNPQGAKDICCGGCFGFSSSAKPAPVEAEPVEDDCGDDCCGGPVKPASAPINVSKVDECSGGCCSGPAKQQVKRAPVDDCNDGCCGPTKALPADDNDNCCGGPNSAKDQNSKGEIEK